MCPDGLLSPGRNFLFFCSTLLLFFEISLSENSVLEEVGLPSCVVDAAISPPTPFQVYEGKLSHIYINIKLSNLTLAESDYYPCFGTANGSLTLQVVLQHPSIARIAENATLHIGPSPNQDASEWKVRVEGIKLGKTPLSIYYLTGSTLSDVSISYPPDYVVEVLRNVRLLDLIFNYGIAVMIAFNVMMLGCRLQWSVIKELLKRPASIIIGTCCQFLFMPLLAFGLAAGFNLQVEYAVGLLLIGCCPGGGLSNFFCFLLDGHLVLSMTMTFISTLLALGFMPLNLFAYTRYWDDQTRFPVPIIQVFVSLALFCVPVAAGMYLRHRKPAWAFKVMRMIRPIGLGLVVIICALGIYANIYLVHHITGKTLVSGLLLPSIGFVFGGLVAKLFRRETSHSVTIAIETGIQNAALAIGLIQVAFRQPDADLMAIMPVLASMGQFIICSFAYCFYLISQKLINKQEYISSTGGGESPSNSCYCIDSCDTNKTSKEVTTISNGIAKNGATPNENLYISTDLEETFDTSNQLMGTAITEKQLTAHENKVDLYLENETNM